MKRRWTHQASLPLDKVPQGARALEEVGVKFTNGKRLGVRLSNWPSVIPAPAEQYKQFILLIDFLRVRSP